ncbi:glycosyltransferase family 4 protein [Paenibacillus provencensis]|uniref:glycosyltransferase family 4 protein n=1 Tax=Paenibacillus provencensis TaxID=441151 RepID=UPI0036D36187
MKKILYLRNFASTVNRSSYNLQEIGLGKAFVKKGYDCDIIYYSTDSLVKVEEIFNYNNNRLSIMWMKGIKFLSNSIYTSVLSKKFLEPYDLIITTEYNQLMTPLLTLLAPHKTVLYHGPYRDNNNKAVRTIYDMVFKSFLAKKIKTVYVKSDLAKQYLENKGFQRVVTVGVGLDKLNFETEPSENIEISELIAPLKNKKVLLYLGILEERRNVIFLLSILKEVVKRDDKFRLLMIGDGQKEDTDRYWKYVEEHHLRDYIIYLPKVKQSEVWQVYGAADIMVFPTTYDIFGMVLLESMHFQVPIISSVNGGAVTVIKNGINGVIVEASDERVWVERILDMHQDQVLLEKIKSESRKTIENLSWDEIADSFIQSLDDKTKEGVAVDKSTAYS